MKNLNLFKNLLWVLLISITFYSCQQEEEVLPAKSINLDKNFVSLDEAKSIAMSLEHPKESPQQAKLGKRTFSVKDLSNAKRVPDQNGNTAYYIINYKQGGFIMIAADKRSNPILAYSERNAFSLNEKKYPNGLVDWLANTSNKITEIRNGEATEADPLVAQSWNICPIQLTITPDINSDGIDLNTTRIAPPSDDCDGTGGGCQNQYTTVGPLLSTKWGQWGAYNNNAPLMNCNNSDGRAPTGCVATAMAQVMKYHNYPNNYSWGSMPNTYGTTATAQLMRDAGDAVGMDYGCDGSGASMEDVDNALRNTFSYSSASQSDYNYSTVKNELRYNRPVILSGGRDTGWWIFGVYSDGHAWVCDGYRSTYYCESGTSYLYYSMNWGWDGSYDGWFAFNNFNPGDYTFNYKRKMVYNIRP